MDVPPVGPPNRCCEPVHILLGPTAGRVCGSSLIGSNGWLPIQGDSRPASMECSVTAVTSARQPSHVCCGDWRGRRTQTCSPSTTVRSRSTTFPVRRFNSLHNETRMVACRFVGDSIGRHHSAFLRISPLSIRLLVSGRPRCKWFVTPEWGIGQSKPSGTNPASLAPYGKFRRQSQPSSPGDLSPGRRTRRRAKELRCGGRRVGSGSAWVG